MIFDSVAHIDTYQGLDARISRGLQLLTQDHSQTPIGKYLVDGTDLFYMIQSYDTNSDTPFPEAHRNYADIQCILEGQEVIAVHPVSSLTEVEAHPDRDLWLYQKLDDSNRVVLTTGTFMVLWPQDAHAAAIAAGEPSTVRKIVVKVKISE